ncbi:MAG: peptidylprolyl isomerase [Gammaproteobacteria bacterium]|nr:MAG: peptidylprolyl isomerase [Gammaproteobacteria bacterium]
MMYKFLFFILVSALSGSQPAAAPLSFPIGKSEPETTSQKPVIEPLNHIVATVNDDVILASELRKREAMVASQLQQQQGQLPPREALRKQVLDRLILENLQLQMANRNGIRIDDETLNNNLRKMAKQNGMSLSEFREVLEQDGFEYVAFREQFRNQITINRIRQQMVESRIEVSEQEVDNLLATASSFNNQNREYHLAHILVSIPEAASPEQVQAAKERAQDILTRLRGGADFGQTAAAESDGQQALEGGDLGWRKSSQLPSFFADTVVDLKPGEVSDPLRSPSGFHIIKLVDTRGGEARHLIKQTRARHILLRPDALVPEKEVQTRMARLRERIAQGEDFATLARANSQDPGSGSNGGELGWVTPGQMVPEFEQAMDQLEPGETSEPIKSRFGWHLIQVQERREQDDTEEHRRNSARESIRLRKTEEELEIWLRRLRDESYVEYHLDDS